jgi:type IV secretory pathway VirD2 relaxase
MRERAAELVTIELGPQSEHEVRRKLAGEVAADRWTRLDATLRREAQRTKDSVLDFRPEVARSGAVRDEIRALLIGRLQKLERMGLARAIGPAQWLLAEEAEPSLRELGTRGDIIRTMQRALSAQGQERSPEILR